jgi:thiamine-monophosphate kinase
MIDLSDGLAQDLSHICVESSVGAEVFAAKIPLSRPYRRYSGGDLSFALAGGEDYELLFTAPPKRLEAISKAASAVGCEVHVVGHVVRGRGVVVRDAAGKEIDLRTAGFDHFARR